MPAKGAKKTVQDLVFHLKIILEFEKVNPIPDEPPMDVDVGGRKKVGVLGTVTPSRLALDASHLQRGDDLKRKGYEEMELQEFVGVTAKEGDMQEITMPDNDCNLVGKRISMFFEVVLVDESADLLWCNGVITDVTDGSSNIVTIRWDRECLCDGEPEVQYHKLSQRKYN